MRAGVLESTKLSSKTKGPGEKEIIQKFRLRNWPISSADFPMTPMDGTEHHFGPFLEKDFGAISAPCSPGPLVLLLKSQKAQPFDQKSLHYITLIFRIGHFKLCISCFFLWFLWFSCFLEMLECIGCFQMFILWFLWFLWFPWFLWF